MATSAKLWRLDGSDSSLVLINDKHGPRLCWFGPRLNPDVNAKQFLVHDDTALAFGGLDAVVPLPLFPQASTGFTGSAALNGHRQGRHFAHRFNCTDIQSIDNTLQVQLTDQHVHLEVRIIVSLDRSTDVASVSTTLTNHAQEPFTVDWLASATLALPDNYQECLTQHGRWGLENQSCRRLIAPGRLDICNLHGRTSHEHAPGILCGTQGFNSTSGDVLFAHLAWSGNFSLRLEKLSDGTQFLQAGALYLPGEQQLEPGASITTPSLVFTRTTGMNAGTQRFHNYARKVVLPAWTRKPRPVHANSWEALYFNHDTDALLDLIDASAALGAERFILDDGWFRHRRDDSSGLGDWFVDESIYPDGLHPIVNRVRQHGMQFGLWFEPEMVNPDSDLYRAHPDWALRVENIDTPLARQQLVLDIARDDVAAYLYQRLIALVREYAIDYIKWDFNRDLVLAGDGHRARAAQQPPALYQLLRNLQTACPSLEIETCASGGARSDLAILEHTGRVWASDNIDPIERASIQAGFLRFLPPEIMGAHVGHEKAHLTGRVTSLHTRAIMALQGQYGFELDARRLDKAEQAALHYYTSLYKKNRHWLSESTYWQLEPSTSDLLASGLVDQTQTTGFFSVIALQNTCMSRPGRLPLQGLDRNQSYQLRLASQNLDELQAFNKAIPAWCETPEMSTGQLLMQLGVPLPVMPPQSALLIACERLLQLEQQQARCGRPDMEDLKERFIQAFGNSSQPIHSFYAPGRVNLIGEYTDFTGGLVFPCAINHGTTLLIRINEHDLTRMQSTNFEFTVELEQDQLAHKQQNHWVNYPLGVINQFVNRGIAIRGFDLLYSGDVPNGAGLSSSASISVVTALALNHLLGNTLSQLDLVKIARAAENEFVGMQCGIMDQFAVTMAQADHAMLLNCASLDYQQVELKLDDYTLLVSNTNQRRELSDSAYNDRVQECQRALSILQPLTGISALGELTPASLQQHATALQDDPVAAQRAQHICHENERVRSAAKALDSHDLEAFGRLMNASHESLRDLFAVSSAPLDHLVRLARETPGVLGSRLTGAGFGGCTVTLLPKHSVADFKLSVGLAYHKATGLEADFYDILPSAGAREL